MIFRADQRGGGILGASRGFESRQNAEDNQPPVYASQSQAPAFAPENHTQAGPFESRGPAFAPESRASGFAPESTAPPLVTEGRSKFLPEDRTDRAVPLEAPAPAAESVRRPPEPPRTVFEPHHERSSPSTSDRSSQPSPQSSRARPDPHLTIPEQPAVAGQQQGPAQGFVARQGTGQAPLTNGRPHGAAVVAGGEKSDGELFSRELTAVAALEVSVCWL